MAAVAQIVHVDRGRREQNALLQHAQAFARARDLAFRRAGPVGGLIAVEKRLRDREAGGARWVGAVNFGSDELGRRAALGRIDVGVLIAEARGQRDLGPIAGKRLWYVFVGRPDRRALRVELGVVLIGAHQRRLDRVGKHGRRAHAHQQKDRSRSPGNDLHPTHSWHSIHFSWPAPADEPVSPEP